MIDLHTHTILSDGELLPSELVRYAQVAGYEAIGLTDHVDSSNIDFVLPRLVKVCGVLNSHWPIISIPGVEITHAPIEEIKQLVRYARRNGARIVIVHGETVSEPVMRGTNRAGIEAGADIIAHPGFITQEDARLAAKRGVLLELTTRRSHSRTNSHVVKTAMQAGARLVINTDSHSHESFITDSQRKHVLKRLGLKNGQIAAIDIASRKFL